ncbi:response regulator [Bradyrhizobium sp. dw_411]|uniref:response regulator transcription factor n=1 Tax=Bradyrhizobium sp. dw_411 TaxID=2720082 RepID=UPI001BCE4B63|nr:response regulator [Bradyrhizobium sp. dw_411]
MLAQSNFLGGTQDVPRDRVSRGEIFVMDEDVAMRETLSIALQEEGYDVVCFADGAALLALARERTPVCMFIEVRNPDQAGLDILKKLRAEDYPAPVFIISGHGDIPMAVAAIRHGALDFIEKPFRSTDVVARLKAAMGELSRWQQAEIRSKSPVLQFPGCEPLTRREQQVLERLAAGVSNKEAARQLGLSARTVEGHRANIMRKVGVKNAAQLFRRILGER